jgi:hypothetical protein
MQQIVKKALARTTLLKKIKKRWRARETPQHAMQSR